MEERKFNLDISWTAILKVAVTVFVFYLLYLTGPLLVWVLFAVIVSMLFSPVVDYLETKRLPRGLSVILIYGLFFFIMGFAICRIAPILVNEMQQFSQFFPSYFEKFSPPFSGLGVEALKNAENIVALLEKSLAKVATNLFGAIFSIFGGIFSTIFVLAVAVFLSLEKNPIERALVLLVPKHYEEEVLAIWRKGRKKVSYWFLSRVLACVFIGVASYIAFLIFRIPYSFSLALLAGLLNFIPILGPFITGAILFLLTVFGSLAKALLVVFCFFIIQQIENNIISPLLTKKFVGLSPAVVLIALAIGGKLWGFLGAILAIPLFALIVEFAKEILKLRKQREKTAEVHQNKPRSPEKPIIF